MRSPIWILGFALLLGLPVTKLLAGDIRLGQAKANAACAVCHGPMGIAQMPSAPNLAGQHDLYVSEQLKLYRSGKRSHEVMAVIAKTLTDDDISNLAAWYGSIRITIEPQ